MKLTKLLSEVLNTYIVTCDLMSDPSMNITEILNGVRALEKVIIVNNITPEKYPQKSNIEFTRITIKFITREDPAAALGQFKQGMTTSDTKGDTPTRKIEGIKSANFYEQTLKRV